MSKQIKFSKDEEKKISAMKEKDCPQVIKYIGAIETYSSILQNYMTQIKTGDK